MRCVVERRVVERCGVVERRRRVVSVHQPSGDLEPTQGGAGTREEPGTLTQGAPVFPGSSRLEIESKTPGCLVQDPTTRPIGDLIPTIWGSVVSH